MLQVGVHHREVGRRAGEHAFDAGRRQAAPADAMQAAHAVVLLGALAHQLLGAVERIVHHHDGFPVDAVERLFERGQQRGDVLPLPECRHDDRKLGHPD